MSKVTSKLQLTVPKSIADQYGIRPGDELQWTPAGESIRIELGRGRSASQQRLTVDEKIQLFDRGTERLNKIQKKELKQGPHRRTQPKDRGWRREDLYTRGFPR